MSAADDAWEAWRERDDNEWHAHPITRSTLDAGFAAGYRRALEDAADEWEALVQQEKPPIRGSVWLRARAAADREHGNG